MYRQAGHISSIETCIQYLMLNHEEHTRRFGARTKHYPPIRPKAETEKLWKHIANNDCTSVSSGHVSWGLERKENPNVFKNASGGPGLETLLPAFWTGCQVRGISPSMVTRQLSSNPARHFLLDGRKGSLNPGADADIVILKPDCYKYDPSNSPGVRLKGWSLPCGLRQRIVVEHWFLMGTKLPVHLVMVIFCGLMAKK